MDNEKTDCHYKTIRFHSSLKNKIGENVTQSPEVVKYNFMAILCLVILEIYSPDIVHYGSTEFINSICNHYKKKLVSCRVSMMRSLKNPGFLGVSSLTHDRKPGFLRDLIIDTRQETSFFL
jgi:hypothetical protein